MFATAAAGLFPAAQVLAAPGAPLPAARASGQHNGATSVARYLQRTMDRLRFQQVLDLAPPSSAQFRALDTGVDKDATTPARRAQMYATDANPQPISQQPQIDATVLELDRAGRIVSSGTVLMSPQYPHGVVVPVDQNLHTDAVRWWQWDDLGWYANHAIGTIDVVPGRQDAPLRFMLPYPASVLKLMVNFGVLRLVDQGEIKLDDTYDYQPSAISSLCGGPSSNTVRRYIDASLTWSSNAASW